MSIKLRWFDWIVIWAAVLIAAHFWLQLDLKGWWLGNSGRWGLAGYIHPATYRHESRLAFTVLVVAGLLVWQSASARKP